MSDYLRIALLHISVAYGRPEENRQALLGMIDRAARAGADLIVAPEMALSGYSFDSRDAIAPLVEYLDGPTVTAVGDLARLHGVYVCVGLALEEPRTGIFYNSAVVVDPAGKVACRYNKINAESRWACPGDARQKNVFVTPWGRMGLLICSDSYYGLMPRVTALRGADLLLMPANWPPSGLDPRELWRTRAMENGFQLVACNRTGIDRIMDCRKASSCVYDPEGRMLLDASSDDSKTLFVDVPLTVGGRLDNTVRRRRMDSRCPHRYNDCYLNLRPIQDLTSFLNLPAPGILDIHGVIPGDNEHPIDALLRGLDSPSASAGLFLLPWFAYSEEALRRIGEIARDRHVGVATCRKTATEHRCVFFPADGEMQHWPLAFWACEQLGAYPQIDFASARLKLASFDFLTHPEAVVAAAKKGCDVVATFDDQLTGDQCLLAGVRTIEHLAVAGCTPTGAGIWLPPDGHQRWQARLAGPGEVCHCALDTHRTRRKRFQDAIDFDLLLRRPGGGQLH